MLQVYDRIIPSRSIPSLIALALLALLLYAFQGAFDLVRGRILVRISGVFDEVMSRRIFKATLKAPLKGQVAGDGLSVLRDFDQVRGFLSSPGPSAFFDLPWVPLYVGICFLFHPVIGIITVSGALILTMLTYLTNRSSQSSARQVYELAAERNALAALLSAMRRLFRLWAWRTSSPIAGWRATMHTAMSNAAMPTRLTVIRSSRRSSAWRCSRACLLPAPCSSSKTWLRAGSLLPPRFSHRGHWHRSSRRSQTGRTLLPLSNPGAGCAGY